MGAWFAKQGPADTKMNILDATIRELKEKHDVKKIAIIGFCYGARACALYAAKDDASVS